MTKYKEVLFWVILFPILWYGLMVAIWGFSQPANGEAGRVRWRWGGEDWLGSALMKAINASGVFDVKIYDSPERLYDDVRKGGWT